MGRKSWRQKLEGAPEPHVSVLEKPFAGLPAGARVFIASPKMVQDYMASIAPGKTGSIQRMREEFAGQSGADGTCPLTASIFARIAAEAALDEIAAGRTPAEVTPFWRLIDEKSPIAKKLSCGVEFIRTQRALESKSP